MAEEKKEDKLLQSGQSVRIEPPSEIEELKKKEVGVEAPPKSQKAKSEEEKKFPYQPLSLEKKKEPMPALYVILLIVALILFFFSALIVLLGILNWPVPGFIRSLLRM